VVYEAIHEEMLEKVPSKRPRAVKMARQYSGKDVLTKELRLKVFPAQIRPLWKPPDREATSRTVPTAQMCKTDVNAA